METEAQQHRSEETQKSFFLKNYHIQSVLKSSAKGSVYLAREYDELVRYKLFVVKKGNASMPADEYGRTMKHRLQWQMMLHKSLPSQLGLPNIIEFFQYKRNFYLIMEHIEGTPLREELSSIFEHQTWDQLVQKKKRSVLTTLLRIIYLIRMMHSSGYIHRDITPENFLINADGFPVMIDVELSHPIHEKHPSPPFALGTPGFMSWEQRLRYVPTVKEDIYGLGALMLATFTNLPPLKFDMEDSARLGRALSFLGIPVVIQQLVSRCLNEQPAERPELSEIRMVVEDLLNTYMIPGQKQVEHLIRAALAGLISTELKEKNQLFRKGLNAGFAVPCLGIQQLINEYGTKDCPQQVLSYFKDAYAASPDLYQLAFQTTLPGLFCGQAGNALGFYAALQTGMLDGPSPAYPYDWIEVAAPSLDLANGTAGQVMALLLITRKHHDEVLEAQHKKLASHLCDTQLPDGSWPMEELRLADGVAGVLLALLKYYSHRPEPALQNVIRKGLNALRSALDCTNSKELRQNNTVQTDLSLMGGSAGIALVFIYAYQIFEFEEDAETAEMLLGNLSEQPYSFDFSLESGLAGIGLVCARAASILKRPKWSERLSYIYHLLDHLKISDAEDHIHWNMRGQNHVDDTLLSGNAGIIYFLMSIRQLNVPKNKLTIADHLF
jgi:hypothetical protein